MNEPQVLVGVKGAILGIPVQAQVWSEKNGVLCWKGNLELEGLGVHKLLTAFNPDLFPAGTANSVLIGVVDELVGDAKLHVEALSKGEYRSFEFATRNLVFQAIRRSNGSALVMRWTPDPDGAPKSSLLKAVDDVRRAMGLQNLVLAYRGGEGVSGAELLGGQNTSPIPSPLKTMEWLAWSRFKFAEGTKAAKALDALLGIQELDFYLGAAPGGGGGTNAVAALSIPRIATKSLAAKDLYILVGAKNGRPSFEFHGTLEFYSLGGASFTVHGMLGPSSFVLAAEMQAGEKASFAKQGTPSVFDLFTLEEAGILIGYQSGLTFGVFATITACRQMVFGAAILTLEGEIPVPRLVSGAIDPVSLPVLFANATGTALPGLNALDIVSIDRFDRFGLSKKFDVKDLEDRDRTKVADFFNANVNQVGVSLDPDALQIRPRQTGFGLVDQKRMRHYFVDKNTGELSLQPQFYVSEIDLDFGSYSVTPGIFLAGKITILGKSFEVLFSLSKEAGIVAYAKLDPIELVFGGFTALKICASLDPVPNPLPLSKNNLASQLVPEHAKGPVFFLSASKKDISFYFDGHLELLKIFEFDARIVYLSRRVSVHAVLVLWGIRLVLLLDADYANLLSGFLSFKLQLDTKLLTDRLEAVTKAIDKAIVALREAVGNATTSLQSAQTNVNQLRGQIQHLDGLIRACRNAIEDANWWKKAIVAVAKGAEIAAYEVAKAGVWTAIGVATAALEVARLAVGAFGVLGEGLMRLVNETIHAATSLLYLRSAEISADISAGSQKLGASISFVALGEEFEFKKQFQLDILHGDFLKFLSDELLEFLKEPLKNVSDGKPPRVANESLRSMGAQEEIPMGSVGAPPTDVPDILEAAAEITRVSEILSKMQETYRTRFGEDLADFSEMNASFAAALQVSGNALSTAEQAASATAFKSMAEYLESLGTENLAPESRTEFGSALARLKDSIRMQEAASKGIEAISEVRRGARASRPAEPSLRAKADKAASQDLDGQMLGFLDEIEDLIQGKYAGPKDAGYIDLSLEPSLESHFRYARTQLHSNTADLRGDRRSKRRSTSASGYRPRL